MAALMKQHGHSLDGESLQTLLCEVEAVVNSRPLTSYLATNAEYTSHRQDQTYSSSSREVSKRRCLLQATLEACTAYCERVLKQVEQGIFTEPTSKTKVDTPEKELH